MIGGQVTPAWVNVRQTNNYNSRAPVTDVKSADFRCYTSQTGATATTVGVTAGSSVGFRADDNIYHAGVRLSIANVSSSIIVDCLARLSMSSWLAPAAEARQHSAEMETYGSRSTKLRP